MDQSDTDQLNPLLEDNSRVNRHITLPACVTSGLASAIPTFCIGLVSGAAGGLLLGATAVVVLQSLELLADNRLLMDQLENFYINHNDHHIGSNNLLHDIHISILAEMFGLFSSTMSVVVGICTGLLTYSRVIKTKGEAAMGKALGFAGPVCLTGVTATGYILGLSLQSFLSIPFNDSFWLWFIFFVVVVCLLLIIFWFVHPCMCALVGGMVLSMLSIPFNIGIYVCISVLVACPFPIIAGVWVNSHFDFNAISLWFFTPIFAMITFALSLIYQIKLNLAFALTPTILSAKQLSLKLNTVTVPLMLIISDVYNITGHQIVSLESQTSANTSSTVLEAIFVGVFASQLLTVTVGMSLFVSWQRGGAGKICAAAAGSGGAVLTAIKSALPVLGPGPTIGALMGVTGAVGVSIAAAVEATDQYRQVVDHYGLVGRLGVTVGAAAGSFLSSCAHSGLSGVFICLCAATIPAGDFVKRQFLCSTLWKLFVCLLICAYIGISLGFTIFANNVWLFCVLFIFSLCNAYTFLSLWFLA